LRVHDSTFKSVNDAADLDQVPGGVPLVFENCQFIAGNYGILVGAVSNVTVVDSVVEAANNGIQAVTNQWGEGARTIYLQNNHIYTPLVGIVLESPMTQLWLYDSTVKNMSYPSILGFMAGPLTGMAPRIADSRLEMDTNPSQGVGGLAGWNAFGGWGNVGGPGEDSRGNLVAPNGGVTVAP
jgi:hypothetical protein